jgi:hypothetical protein
MPVVSSDHSMYTVQSSCSVALQVRGSRRCWKTRPVAEGQSCKVVVARHWPQELDLSKSSSTPSTARSATQHPRIALPSHSLPALFLHLLYPNMSFASPMPLKAVAPARIVSASRRCQRRNMSHARAQLHRPSIGAQKPIQNVSPVRVSHSDPPHVSRILC